MAINRKRNERKSAQIQKKVESNKEDEKNRNRNV